MTTTDPFYYHRTALAYHPGTPETAQVSDKVREITQNALRELYGIVPPGKAREKAIEHLIECQMWAEKAISLTSPERKSEVEVWSYHGGG